MNKRLLNLMLLVLFVSPSFRSKAHADIEEQRVRCFQQFHFSKFAFGKEVKSVKVHTGALMKQTVHSRDQEMWTNIQDIQMQSTEFGFFAKAMFDASTYFNYNRNAQFLVNLEAPVVQYWIEFMDDSTLISEVSKLDTPVYRADEPTSDYQGALRQYVVAQSAKESFARCFRFYNY